jgi:hypothetical protein
MKYEMAFCQFEVGFLLEDELVREAVFKKGDFARTLEQAFNKATSLQVPSSWPN